MIRYAITGGNHGLFLKRDRAAVTPGHAGPFCLDDPDPFPDTPFLPSVPSTSLLDQVRCFAQQGVGYLQLREKHLAAGELAAIARQVLDILNLAAAENGFRTRLLINTRADVAAATGADGVHLPAAAGGLLPSQVRRLYRSIGLAPPIVSQACHTLAEIRNSLPQQPDLILFSPVFGKTMANGLTMPPVGLGALREACHLAASVPVLALGGVTEANTAACLEAGAAGIAAIRLFQPV